MNSKIVILSIFLFAICSTAFALPLFDEEASSEPTEEMDLSLEDDASFLEDEDLAPDAEELKVLQADRDDLASECDDLQARIDAQKSSPRDDLVTDLEDCRSALASIDEDLTKQKAEAAAAGVEV